MNKETTNMRRYFTKIYNQYNKTPFAWYNTQYKKLSKEGIYELKKYFCFNQFIKEIIIVHNIEITRPQRTWEGFPEWFRPASIFNRFDGQPHDNSFVLAIYNELDYEEADIQEALKSFPNTAEIIRIRSYKDEQGDNQKTNR